MIRPVFLDTTVFFDSIDDDRMKTIMDHAINAGFALKTSITVIGEALTQMRENREKDRYVPSFLNLLDSWEINIHYPNDPVRILCYIMGDEEIDSRIIREVTDRTHLAYAMAYHSEFFITSDKNMRAYRVQKNWRTEVLSNRLHYHFRILGMKFLIKDKSHDFSLFH